MMYLYKKRKGVEMGLKRKGLDSLLIILKNRKKIGELLKDHFSSQTISGIREGKIVISEDVIFKELKKYEEIDQWLKSVHCYDDGIVMDFEGKKFSATLSAQIHLYIQKLILSDNEQVIEMKVIREALESKDVLGKVICCMTKVLLGSFTKYAIDQSELSKYVVFDDKSEIFSLELGELEVVRKLLKPVLYNVNESIPLNLIGVESATHINGGIELKLSVPPLVKSYLDGTKKTLKNVSENEV